VFWFKPAAVSYTLEGLRCSFSAVARPVLPGALELIPFSPASFQKIGSMRVWPSYQSGFAGKSAALMLSKWHQVQYEVGHGRRCLFKRKGIGVDVCPCSVAVPAFLSVASRE